jgi:diaminohydroxyphosphoribosylaminopyrimidine deaminase/5-amino-6-(5-phosphoribosylamino)uracil reductase
VAFSAFDHRCMASALKLASCGLNTTHPNPRVACVIAADDKVLSTGWHKRAGDNHAEVNALIKAGDRAAGSTAYVTLEPCNHHARTPPCVDALIKAKVKRVVFAIEDPNPEVSGAGKKRLSEAGIVVQSGLMAKQAEELNAGFLMRMRQGRPWVRVKLAQSMDGHIALSDGSSQWISGPQARADVQNWRARSDAILTGIGTVLADDPSLNVRLDETARQPLKQPLRVIADSQWRTPAHSKLLGLDGKVVIAGLDENDIPDDLVKSSAEIMTVPSFEGRISLHKLLQKLGKRGINEVQVEAGAVLCGALLQQNLIDEILIYQAPVMLGGGAVSPFATPRLDNMEDRVHLEWVDTRRIGDDLRLRMKPINGLREN